MKRAGIPRLAITAGILSLALSACSSIPGSGPRTGDMERGVTRDGTKVASPYVLVDLTQDKALAVSTFVANQLAQGPVSLPPAHQPGLIGPGDVIKVAIWAPNPEGTSLTNEKSGINTTTRVGTDGTIGVPYAGRLTVAGRTPAQVERELSGRLAGQSPGAQVAVLVEEDLTNAVIVQGAVVKPGRYAVVPHASQLLDVLAMAGGPQTTNYQALVRITRGGRSVTRTLTHLMDDAAPEIELAPGDRVLVLPRQDYFFAFGDVNKPGEQPYDADAITLSRTLARLEGLADNRADPAAVFLYRHQPAELTRQIAGFTSEQDPTQVIYRLNLRDPNGFFVGQAFPVQPDDMIYVSDAPIAEAAKVFQIITGLSSLGAIPRNFGAQY